MTDVTDNPSFPRGRARARGGTFNTSIRHIRHIRHAPSDGPIEMTLDELLDWARRLS